MSNAFTVRLWIAATRAVLLRLLAIALLVVLGSMAVIEIHEAIAPVIRECLETGNSL